ncbi:MAG TPA: hypothetical protein P5277_01215 [Candidatus Paceibacterota bacterium]|nr:hypothetical protein [Candidatus Paceibacterota bacterium]
MAGIIGVVSGDNCTKDLYLGIFYLQHRAQNYCGMQLFDGKYFDGNTHRGLLKQQFTKEVLKNYNGKFGIGAVSINRQPLSEFSSSKGHSFAYDGNLINSEELKLRLIQEGECFSGYQNPEDVNDTALLSRIIAREKNFEKGIESLVNLIQGDFSVVCLKKEGVYAARGWGRKPLILGKKDGSYAVSSESNSFVNTGFDIVRDVEPGETVLLTPDGINSIQKLNLEPIKLGTFEWIYTAHPASVIDGKNVAEVRTKLGGALAKRFNIDADFVSPFPNSGRWHALGYSHYSKIPYLEAFIRYDYSDRSYTPLEQSSREEEAKTKLIPIEEFIKERRLIIVDDSIVRGNQTENQVKRLRKFGAKEVHIMIACPPLMHACKYGKSTKKDEDCIARRMSLENLRKKLDADSLNYATIEDLEEATGYSKDRLCLECWDC